MSLGYEAIGGYRPGVNSLPLNRLAQVPAGTVLTGPVSGSPGDVQAVSNSAFIASLGLATDAEVTAAIAALLAGANTWAALQTWTLGNVYSDRVSDPGSPTAGEVWRRGQVIYWRDSSGTIPLTPEVSSWTPTLTFATPGDLSVSYTNQFGQAVRIGRNCLLRWRLTCTPTYTTSSGSAQIAGLPFVSNDGDFSNSNMGFFDPTGIFTISQENIFCRPSGGGTTMAIQSVTTGGSATPVAAAINNIVAGVSPTNRTIRSAQALDLKGWLWYRTA